jgi:hypothetical protein
MPKKDMLGLGKMGMNMNMPDMDFGMNSGNGLGMDMDFGLDLGGSMERFGGKSKSARKEKPVDWKEKGKQAKEVGTRIYSGYKNVYHGLRERFGKKEKKHRKG